MRIASPLACLLAAAVLTAAACSRPPGARFTAETPSGWSTKETRGIDSSLVYRSGSEEISATNYGRKGSYYAEPKDLFNSLGGAGNVIRPEEEVVVAGQKLKLFRGRHEEMMGGGAFQEDWVFVTVGDGFWALRYSRPAPSPSGPPPSDHAWRRFLATFQPTAGV